MTRWIALCLMVCSVMAIGLGLFQSANQYIASQSPEAKSDALFGTNPYLAYIGIDGMIREEADSDGVFDRQPSSVMARKLLYKAAKDNNVKGVLLRINSPGGTVGMSQELYQAVIAVKKKKPVVISMGDVAASGGYYTAAPADKIYANPGTLTASIGVIIHSMNIEDLLKSKLGVKPITVKSGKYKDILSPYRPTSADELALIQDMVNISYDDFITAVLDGRTGGIQDEKEKAAKAAKIRAIADGRILTGRQAVEVGLVDEIGGLHEAKEGLQELVKKRFTKVKSDLPVQHYGQSNSWIELLSSPTASIDLVYLLQFLPGASPAQPQLPQVNGMTPAVESTPIILNQPLWLME